MRHGLTLVQIAITYYRPITIVGWASRIAGDEWELAPGARVITRSRGAATWTGFDDLASGGLGDKYRAHAPMRQPEPLHRLLVRRCKPADEKAWASDCPRPKNWKDAP